MSRDYMRKKTLTVLCPVYNEEEIIETFYTELKNVLSSLPDNYKTRIMFVVDRSEDGTIDVLKRICELDSTVILISLSARFGHQMSLLAGIDHCDSEIIIMMDSDLQHPPSLIPSMLKKYEEGHDIVYTIRQASSDISFISRIGSKFFYLLVNKISSTPIYENAADFRLISQRVAKLFQNDIRERNLFLRGLFSWVGFKRTAVNFQASERGAGKSKYSLLQLIYFSLNGLIAFSSGVLRMAIMLGILFALFGILLGAVTLVQYFFYDSLPPGWATLTILLSVYSGIQLFFLGVIGEYIGATYIEVKKRPHYIVDEKIGFNESER